jgi:hypothetical protein
MSEENKPVTEADPGVQNDTAASEAAAIRERIAATEQNQANNDPLKKEIVADTTEGKADVSTQGGSSKVDVNADVAALQLIEASTGRKFSNVDEAKKYLSNLNSLVGDQEVAKAREAAKALADLTSKFGKTPAELEKLIADKLVEASQPKETPVEKAGKEADKDEFMQRLERLEHAEQSQALREKYPGAAEVVDVVAMVAKASGKSYIEAFESSPMKELVELKAKEDAGKTPIVTPSTKTNIDYKKATELGQRVLSGKASESDKEELVKTVLGIK